MSRFFVTVSESESESSSSEEEMLQRPVGTAFQFSDDEEETKRIVRSSKEKRYEELSNIIKTVRNLKKVKDMSKLLTSFEDLCKAFTKAKPTIDKEDNGVVPVFYIKCLVEMDDFIIECWEDREGRKKLSKTNSRFLGPLRQKLRKYIRDFENEMRAYRENPDMQEEGEEEKVESESDDDDDDGDMDDYMTKSFKKTVAEPKKKFVKTEDESDDDSYWGGDSDEDTTSSSDGEIDPSNMAARFLKKSKDEEKSADKKKKDKKEKREIRRRDDDDDDDEDDGQGEWLDVKDGVRLSQKPKMFPKDAEINHTVVIKKLTEILAARGKKGTDRSEQIELLQELYNIAELNNLGPAIGVKIMFAIIAAIFDYNPNIATCMRGEMWNKCLMNINNLLTKLTDNSNIIIGELITEDIESLAEPPYKIRGCMLSVAERMDEEFTKMLQGCDAHSTEYVDRLKDEKTVCDIIAKLQTYYDRYGSSADRCRIYLRAIEHSYYKFDSNIFKPKDAMEKKDNAKAEKKEPKVDKEQAPKGEKKEETKVETKEDASVEPKEDGSAEKKEDGTDDKKEKVKAEKKDGVRPDRKLKARPYENSIAKMARLCKFIYAKDTTARIRTRAMLCHIYHNALHDNWFEARDLMLMSHLQDNIQHSDVPTQILYNRTMVQLGICAFRHGNIVDAHNCLLDIQSGGRAKELLAQGLLLQRQHERSSEQETIEKRRQMPFHMHINLELLECVYLVSAMLMEIPYIAGHEFDTRRRVISKSFNHQLKISDRQPLVGPPESMREHVVAAAKAMRNGNWEACNKYIINEKMNTKVWDLFHQSDKVREMLTRKIQEETLRTYLFTYSSVYNSISMITLGQMFKLDKPTVHSIISKMIINEEIMVSLDEPSQTVVMHRTEPTRLQSLALQLSEKLANLVDNNERIFDMKQGSFFNRGGDYQNRQNYRGDYHNRSNNRGDYQNRSNNRGGGGGGGGGGQGYQRNQGGYGRNQGGYQRGGDWGDRRQNQRNNY